MSKRVFLIVLDSLGCGEEPDAVLFGDKDCNTLKRISGSLKFKFDSMKKLGMGNIDEQSYLPYENNPEAAYGRLRERSLGKDTTIGHWEISGIVSRSPLATYPKGFPREIIDEFSKLTGRGVLCNLPYSGTDVINDYGEQHMKTGSLIVYTSADSVFQIAAHEDVVPLETLYEYCRIARKILVGNHAVGRVIARPFTGKVGAFTRTSNRHDFSLEPPATTILDALKDAGKTVYAVGKINDIFAGRGITEKRYTHSNTEGMEVALDALDKDFEGLCFINLVEFDMLYGHRQDVDGYANAFAEFDTWLPKFKSKMKDDDVLIITADHGCDPGDSHTDHTREYIPVLLYGKNIKPTNLGTRYGFCDIGATIGEYFNLDFRGDGTSFLQQILVEEQFEKLLCNKALSAMEKAYSPYSQRKVGAAIVTKSGKIYTGCNIESATFTPTCCAERTAIFKAVSEGEKEFDMIAVCGGKDGVVKGLFTPCGVCRQVMAEFCSPELKVLMITSPDTYDKTSLASLLPYSFTPKDMEN